MQDERNIGPNIARLCGLYGVSQQQVAALSEMSINGINNLVKQRTLRPSFSSLHRVGQVFGLSAGHLALPARECVQAALDHWNEGKVSVTSSWGDDGSLSEETQTA